jgi:hypothetical protein
LYFEDCLNFYTRRKTFDRIIFSFKELEIEDKDYVLEFFLDYDEELGEFSAIFITKKKIFSINLIL